MRLSTALAMATTLGTFSSSAAFVFQPKLQSHTRKLSFLNVGSIHGSDWDNDNFLESLGGEDNSSSKKDGSDDIDIIGAKLSGEKESSDGRSAGSGSERFARMMEKSNEQNKQAPVDPPDDPDEPVKAAPSPYSFEDISKSLLEEPVAAPPPPQAQQPPAYPYAYPPPDPNDPNAPITALSYPYPYPPPAPDPNNPNAQQAPPPYPPYPYPYPPPAPDPNNPNAQLPPPPPPPPPGYMDPYAQYPQPPPVTTPQQPQPDGKRVGRNRDADTIANTADLYFAQLKLDSKIRKQALMRGDTENFNKAFEDDRVNQLKESLQDNPHILAERRKAEKEEQILMEAAEKHVDVMNERTQDFKRVVEDVKFTGQNYKQKLMERKNRKKGIKTPPASPEPPVAAAVEAPVEKPPVPPPAPEPVKPPPAPIQPPPVAQVTTPPPPKPEPVKPPPAPIKPPPVSQVSTAPPPPPPAQSILSQARAMPQKSPPVPPPPPAQAQVQVPPQAPPQPPLQPTPTIAETSPNAPVAPSMSKEGEYAEKSRHQIRTLMGLLIKHRGGPGFGAGRLKPVEGNRLEEVLNDVTSMLKEESGFIIEDAIVETPPPPTPEAAPEPVIAEKVINIDAALSGSIQCIEGALGMYKSADTKAKSDLLSPLRAALLSAVDKLDEVIAEQEVLPPIAVSAPPAQPAAPSITSNPSSEGTLKKAYDALSSAVGDGKFGLKNMSSQEAESLVDTLSEMKGILLQELDLGTPQTPKPVSPPTPPADDPPLTNTSAEKKEAGSKFQQMLAKAKAEEAAGERSGLE